MECPLQKREGAEVFVSYVSGSMDPGTANRLEKHLPICKACREELRAQQAVWMALDDWTAPPVAIDFDEHLYTRIRTEEAKPWNVRLYAHCAGLKPLMPLAALCFALACFFVLKSPEIATPVEPRFATAPQIEKVERALDDMEMLKQVDFSALAPAKRLTGI